MNNIHSLAVVETSRVGFLQIYEINKPRGVNTKRAHSLAVGEEAQTIVCFGCRAEKIYVCEEK